MKTPYRPACLLAPFDARWLELVLALNNAAVPNVNVLDAEALLWLAGQTDYFKVALAGDVVTGFLMALGPGSEYASLNYRWFNDRYKNFLYIDRIVVDPDFRGQGIGCQFYADVQAVAKGSAALLTCEVNTRPANPVSLRFHMRQGFAQVGTQETEGGSKSVALLALQL